MTPGLSVVIPVYNEGENIGRLLNEIEDHLCPIDKEVLVVYDFEEDDTIPVVRSLMGKYPYEIRLIRNEADGVLQAIRTGFREAKRRALLVVMADLSDDLAVVPGMLALFDEGYDVVCGSRYMPGGKQIGGPWLKKTLSRSAGISLHLLTGIPTRDVTNSFKLYRKDLLEKIRIESTGGFEIGMEITVKAFRGRRKITEVPVTWLDREKGTSRFRMWKWMPRYLKWYFYALRGPGSRR
jgi:glycosyltransferase involved in cell wall biosynthesis